jgi:hypothetical protein
VLGVFLRLVFVEERNDFSHHCMDRFSFVTHGLSNGDNPDAVLGKLAQIEFLLEGLPEEPAIAVDNDKIEGMLAVAGAFDHFLEACPTPKMPRKRS